VTAATSAQVIKFFFHRAIQGIKLPHLVHADSNHGFILNMYKHVISVQSQERTVSIATGHRLGDRGEFESQKGQEFSLLHVIWTGSGSHPVTYPMGTGSSFPGGKVAVA
jgi:hypothetical protein